MITTRLLHIFTLVGFVLGTEALHAGWNYGSRKNCKVFAKYRVEAHAGYTAPGGGGGNIDRDTGCTWAHAGPIRYTTSKGLPLSEAEGFIGNNAFWGYARSWNQYDADVNLYKKGWAGRAPDADATSALLRGNRRVFDFWKCQSVQSAGNHFSATAVMFHDAASGAPPSITISGVVASFSAGVGYSVLEIVVWMPADVGTIPDTQITPSKIIWRAKAVVHAGRLLIEGDLSRSLFTASEPTTTSPEVVYTIADKEIVVPLPPNTDTETIEISIRGDAGDENALTGFIAPVTIARLPMQGGDENTPCPPIGVPLSREDSASVPYLQIMLPALDARCASREAGMRLHSVTFVSCAKDPRGRGFGPNATANLTCNE